MARVRNGWLGSEQLESLERLQADGGRNGFPGLCREVYLQYAAAHGKLQVAVVGDKNPGYSLFASTLVGFVSGRSFHPHGQRLSRQHSLIPEGALRCNRLRDLAYRWSAYNGAILHAQEQMPDAFLLVRYEDLVGGPVDQLKRICAFVGVGFDPLMLEGGTSRPGGVSWHSNLDKGVLRSRSGHWMSDMAEQDVRLADAICGEVGGRLGYGAVRHKGSLRWDVRKTRGRLMGEILTVSEKAVFRLPLRYRSFLIDGYRRATGTLNRREA
jgi:hypothetical protein